MAMRPAEHDIAEIHGITTLVTANVIWLGQRQPRFLRTICVANVGPVGLGVLLAAIVSERERQLSCVMFA